MTTRRRTLPGAAALAAALLALRGAAAADPSSFDAMAAGRARPGLVLEPREAGGALGSVESIRIGSPGRDGAPVRADGGYRLEGATAGIPVRAVALPPSGPGGGGAGRPALGSEPVILGTANGFAASADVKGTGFAAPFVFALDATGPGGERTVLLPHAGAMAGIAVSASTAGGDGSGEAAAALGNPALRIESSSPAVATVSPEGEVSAQGPGLARVTVSGDGEWAQVLVAVDTTIDSDGDGMPDSFEVANGFLPNDPSDAALDADSDGLTNLDEYLHGTNPRSADTDDDLLSDQAEVLLRGTDPTNADSDGDTSIDGSEVAGGTDPLNPNERPGAPFTPLFRMTEALAASAIRAAASTDDYIYIASADGRIRSYQVQPSFAIFFRDAELLTADLRDVAVDGRTTAFVAAGAAGIHVIDITNPAILVRTSTITGFGNVNGLAYQRGFLYVATDLGFRILRPRPGGTFDNLGSLAVPAFSRLAVSGPIAFLGVPGLNRLFSVDVSDPLAPRELQRFAMPAATSPFRALAASGPFCYVAHGSAGLIAVSAADPANLQVIDSSAADLPGAAVDALSLLGNRIAAHTPLLASRVQLYRARDDGQIERLTEVEGNATGALQLLSHQNIVAVLTPSALSVAQVLPVADRAGAAPSGFLFVESLREAFAPGEEVPIDVRASDDVYIEGVDLFLDGRFVARDTLPPFRFRPRVDPAIPPPYHLEVRAVGIDLQRNEGPSGAVLLRVEEDLDGDGLPDSFDPDLDADGIEDLEEEYPGADGFVSDPALPDTDGDGIADGEEVAAGADGYVTDPASADTDLDGLEDRYEIVVIGSDPTSADSDGDGVPDGLEDSDMDGLVNRDEAALGSNPASADTDADGIGDGLERDLGLDPLRADTDGDGIADGDEDFDADGLANRSEIAGGTDPRRADTDSDGFDDATETDLGTDPIAPTDFSSRAISFASRTVLLRGPVTVGSLTLSSSSLTVPSADGGSLTPLDLTVGGTLTIDAASSIHATAKGYPGGRGPGNPGHLGLGPGGLAAGDPMTGGSHGGIGGHEDDLSGTGEQPVHGSLRRPLGAGGGGSAEATGTARGGSGGGAVRVRAGTIVLDGLIASNGEGGVPVRGAGAGAGGSVWIDCATLRGNGRVEADGGLGTQLSGRRPGGGGGGRIAIECGNASGFDLSRVNARGGGLAPEPQVPESSGGAGTVWLRIGASATGELVIDNGGLEQSAARTVIPGAGEGTIADLGDDYIVRLEGDFPAEAVGLEIDPNVEDDFADAFRILSVDGDRITTEPGLLARTSLGAAFRGVYRLDRLTARGAARVESDAGFILASAAEPLRLSAADLDAAGVALAGTQALTLVDAGLGAGRLWSPLGAFTTLTVRDASLAFGAGVEASTFLVESSDVEAGGPITAGRFELRSSTLTVPEPSFAAYRALDVIVDGTFLVDAESRVDLVGKGLAGGYRGGNFWPGGEGPVGESAAAPRAGGSHGGLGGLCDSGGAPLQAGDGNVASPDRPGGGGSVEPQPDPFAAAHRGGNGGGLARIIAGTIVLEGAIDVSGEGAEHPGLLETPRAGAGAGGGVRIAVTTLGGAGSVLAAGGSAFREGAGHGGAGGGGRIALIYGNRSGFTGSIRAPGGTVLPGPAPISAIGGTGTIYLRAATSPRGEVIVDPEDVAQPGFATVISGDADEPLELLRLTLRRGGMLESERPLRLDALDAGNPELWTIRGGLRAPRLELPPAPLIDLGSSRLDVGEIVSSGAGIGTLFAASSEVVLGAELRAASVHLSVGSVLTVPEATASHTWALELDISGTLRIEAGSAIDLTGKGYAGGGRGGNASRLGQTADHATPLVGGRTGGSHGAQGGVQGSGTGLGTTSQAVFDDLGDPRRPGGGGSAKLDVPGELGFSGGGLARIRAVEVVLDGRIAADGDGRQRPGNTSPGGAGAGGGVRIDAGVLRGAGEISADGGFADGGAGSGAGGGGRIAIHYANRSAFTGTVHAFGGSLVPETAKTSSVGGAGTVYWKGPGQAHGDLVLDNANRAQSASRSQLRPVGIGTILALGATALESSGGFATSDTMHEGQWVVVNGADQTPFLILANTQTVLTTDPATGDMRTAGNPGDAYQGAIILDNLVVTRRAAFTTRGDLIIIATGTVTITDGGSLAAPPVVHW